MEPALPEPDGAARRATAGAGRRADAGSSPAQLRQQMLGVLGEHEDRLLRLMREEFAATRRNIEVLGEAASQWTRSEPESVFGPLGAEYRMEACAESVTGSLESEGTQAAVSLESAPSSTRTPGVEERAPAAQRPQRAQWDALEEPGAKRGGAGEREEKEEKARPSFADATSLASFELPSPISRWSVRRSSTTDVEAIQKSVSGSLSYIAQQAAAMQRSYSSYREKEKPTSRIERAKALVDNVAALCILVNIIWMATAVELNMAAVRSGEAPAAWHFWVDLGFACVFSSELLVKMALYGRAFWTGPGRAWNLFDLLLVGLQTVDLVSSTANMSFFRVFRGFRAIRAARIIRTVRVVRQLRVMVASVACSVSSLFWAFVLLVIVLFLCAMGVQQTVQTTLEQEGLQKQHPQLMKLYGNLPRTMISLFMAISGGADWRDLAEPLEQISQVYLLAYICFVIVVVFGMLNILTAVFVEATANIGQVDADLVIQGHLNNESHDVHQLRQVLAESGTNGNGTISKEEFEFKLEDPKFRAQLKFLDLNIYDAHDVFRLLDPGSSIGIKTDDLVYGLMRLKGPARAVDMATLMFENRRCEAKLEKFIRATSSELKRLRRGVDATERVVAQEDGKPNPPSLAAARPTAERVTLEALPKGLRDANSEKALVARGVAKPSSTALLLAARPSAESAEGEGLEGPPRRLSSGGATSAISDVLQLIEAQAEILAHPGMERIARSEGGAALAGGSSAFSKLVYGPEIDCV